MFLGSLCRTLLCRKWFNYEGLLEKGAQCNVYLDELVKGFLRDSDFKRQREILRAVSDESKHLNGKDTSLKSFPNFKKYLVIVFKEILILTVISFIPGLIFLCFFVVYVKFLLPQ